MNTTPDANLTEGEALQTGVWSYAKKHQLWHFDRNRTEAEFQVIGRLRGDWAAALSSMPFPVTKTVETTMQHRGNNRFFSALHEANRQEMCRHGYDMKTVYGHSFDEKIHGPLPPPFDHISKLLPLENAYGKVTRQLPGEVWPMHFDNYHAVRSEGAGPLNWNDPGIRRLWIALEDWDWGHYVIFGNQPWHGWKAGDIAYFDWLVPHGTANCGVSPRHSLFVTGFAKGALYDWVSSGEFRIIDV